MMDSENNGSETSRISKPRIKRKNFKICAVEGGKRKHPKSVPTEREGWLVNLVETVVIFILFFWDLGTALDKSDVAILYAAGMILSLFMEYSKRTFMLLEEYRHLTSRYEDNWIVLLKDVYYISPECIVVLVTCILCVAYHVANEDFPAGFNYPTYVRMAMAVCLFSKLLRIDDCPLAISMWLSENNGLNYGAGMAYSFFYGYLKLVLPSTGTQEKHLAELMKQYEDTNGIKFAVYKLFILIPQSLRVYVSLSEGSDLVEESKSLPEQLKTVAGVKDRSYKNAVYKIKDRKGSKIYVSAEFATPLKTFKDVVDSVGRHSHYFNKYKKEITLQFYLTLSEVLRANNLHDSCELVFYEDCDDVGQLLLETLKRMKKYKSD